jgi:hypothetical protein
MVPGRARERGGARDGGVLLRGDVTGARSSSLRPARTGGVRRDGARLRGLGRDRRVSAERTRAADHAGRAAGRRGSMDTRRSRGGVRPPEQASDRGVRAPPRWRAASDPPLLARMRSTQLRVVAGRAPDRIRDQHPLALHRHGRRDRGHERGRQRVPRGLQRGDVRPGPRRPAVVARRIAAPFSNMDVIDFFGLGTLPSRIWVARPDGTGAHPLTQPHCRPGHPPLRGCAYDSAAAWSPDGRWIASAV